MQKKDLGNWKRKNKDDKLLNIAISIVVFVIFVCCSTKDNDDVFNGEIRYIVDSGVITENVESKATWEWG